MKLASPEGFRADPDLVIEWYNWRRRLVAAAAPNAAHRALAGPREIVNVTQNVDDLLDRAGARNIIRLHGTLTHDRCHRRCGHRAVVDLADPPPRRACPQCGAPLRPDVVWFGESLPAEAWVKAEEVCADCDLMLVVGTSAVVSPAAGLIGVAKSAGARIVVINTERGVASGLADVECIGPAGDLLPALLSE
jgi:NAD-dependent deacetylase